VTGRIALGVLAAGALTWFAAVALAPALPPLLAAAVYAAGSLVCHQLADRSFHWHGAQLAVCARCTGLYLGACALLPLAWLSPSRLARWVGTRRRVTALLAAVAAPMAMTVAAEWAGWWFPVAITRASTGVPVGAAAALVIAAALVAGGSLDTSRRHAPVADRCEANARAKLS
jgi:uncharacterized membrane protein